MRLHKRLYHASADAMWKLIKQGVNYDGLRKELENIVDACEICRAWSRPGDRSIATSRLATHFNECVEFDLIGWERNIVCHCIDACIRWTETALVPNRETDT